MSKKKGNKKLSPLGNEIEKTLKQLLKDVMAPVKAEPGKEPPAQHSLTDKVKVLERAIKWEAVKNKVTDEEGEFFKNGADE